MVPQSDCTDFPGFRSPYFGPELKPRAPALSGSNSPLSSGNSQTYITDNSPGFTADPLEKFGFRRMADILTTSLLTRTRGSVNFVKSGRAAASEDGDDPKLCMSTKAAGGTKDFIASINFLRSEGPHTLTF